MLNLNAWLILELCDGRRFDGLVAAYRAATADKGVGSIGRGDLEQGLARLIEQGLIEAAAT